MGIRGLAGAAFVAAVAFAGAANASTAAPVAEFQPTACPASVARSADCYAAHHASGAWLLAAVPRGWNHRLIVHAHGGPRLSAPRAGDSAEDLDRFSVMVRAGYAWIGTTYRRGGYGVRMAAADVEDARKAFIARWGVPRRTLLHGQSWGGNVAAKVAELYALDVDGHDNYDGVLVTNGVLMGGTHAYGFRADLRAVYQYYCHNHPAPGEPRYPLWQGLPAGAKMSRKQLQARVDDCTGLDRAPARRTPDQASRLHDILAVTGIAEAQLVSHLAWATNTFRDLVQLRLDGRNPFDNTKTVYRGSHDDKALNAGVERFAADPAAVARLAYDADLSGQIVLPMLTIHARHDPVVSPHADADYAAVVAAAGREALLAQATTDEDQHSRLRDETWLVALLALDDWLDRRQAGGAGVAKPDAAALQARCLALPATAADCRFLPPF
jgi:hypothetical protein